MRTEVRNQKAWITLSPGEFYASNSDVVLTTLLGSCVSACLYDPVNRVAGMNHFLLSNRRYSKEIPICISEAGRYGVNSMELVINQMLRLGAHKKYLRAKAFGGGKVLNVGNDDTGFLCVGDINIRFIREFLRNENIPLISSSLGGSSGRVIRFFSSDFSVYVRSIDHSRIGKTFNKELGYWKAQIRKQESASASVDLW
jgi:chemotaxis protein CheD